MALDVFKLITLACAPLVTPNIQDERLTKISQVTGEDVTAHLD